MGNTSPQKTSRRPSQKQDHCFLGKEHMWVEKEETGRTAQSHLGNQKKKASTHKTSQMYYYGGNAYIHSSQELKT